MENINNFRRSLYFTLRWEGGYVNDSADPGGETKWGISKRAHPDVDIANLTPAKAADIYATDYWDAAGCDGLPFPLCIAVFDTAVNVGVSRARSWLTPDCTPRDYLERRISHYLTIAKKNPALQKYVRGWMNRVNDLKKYIDIVKPEAGDQKP